MVETYVFGHKSPDSDSITSSLVMANLERELGNADAKAYRLGGINKETEFILNYLNIDAPERLESVEDGANVILVDHNSPAESVENLENAKILKVVDHHKLALETSYPLFLRFEPVGCTETILCKLYEENGVEITKEMINCTGCRIDGVKTPYCESLCPIRKCAVEKKFETCGECSEMNSCEKLGAIIKSNSDAMCNLKK